jgi:hypothetical protein
LIQAGSRSLLDAETRYAVVELEATAVAWAIKACRHYLVGCPSFVVKTDHRPLVGLFAKDMVAIDNPRLVRIRESVLGYVFTVEHVPGKTNAAADALSRYPLQAPPSINNIEALEDDEDIDIEPGIADLVASTTRDEELQLLKRCIKGEDVPPRWSSPRLACQISPLVRPNQRAQDRVAASGLPPHHHAQGIKIFHPQGDSPSAPWSAEKSQPSKTSLRLAWHAHRHRANRL